MGRRTETTWSSELMQKSISWLLTMINQHYFVTKSLKKLVIEVKYINMIKTIWQTCRQRYIKMEKNKTVSSQIWNGSGIPSLSIEGDNGVYSLFLDIAMHSISVREIKLEKEVKGIQIREDEIKVSLFANNIILYLRSTPENW